MAIAQVIEVAAINLVLSPHPPGAYEALFRRIRRSKSIHQVYGDRYGIMGLVQRVSDGDEVIALEGTFSTFSRLDPSLPWFNTQTAAVASDDEVDELVLPEHLMPNHRRCEFYFDIASHTLVFQSLARKGGITPIQMHKFLRRLVSDPSVMKEDEAVKLTVIPDSQSISDLLEWKRIRTLHIHATKPNPGDYDPDDLREFEEMLVEQNAQALDLTLQADDGRFLVPTERTQTLAGIASDNGYVEAKGVDATGHPTTKSTRDKKPLLVREYFEEDAETAWDAFRRIAQGVAATVRRRRHRRPGA